jgi:hypothetical protein
MTRLNPLLQFLYLRGHRLGSAARASGVPYGTLCAISSGSRPISSAIREKLASGLGCAPEDIPEPYSLMGADQSAPTKTGSEESEPPTSGPA